MERINKSKEHITELVCACIDTESTGLAVDYYHKQDVIDLREMSFVVQLAYKIFRLDYAGNIIELHRNNMLVMPLGRFNNSFDDMPAEALAVHGHTMEQLYEQQAFFARRDLVEPYDLRYRFSADFDWCIRIMKKADVLHNTHLTLIDYLNEGMTTRNHKASLKERFRIMSRHYGWASTVTHHLWFVLRLLYK